MLDERRSESPFERGVRPGVPECLRASLGVDTFESDFDFNAPTPLCPPREKESSVFPAPSAAHARRRGVLVRGVSARCLRAERTAAPLANDFARDGVLPRLGVLCVEGARERDFTTAFSSSCCAGGGVGGGGGIVNDDEATEENEKAASERNCGGAMVTSAIASVGTLRIGEERQSESEGGAARECGARERARRRGTTTHRRSCSVGRRRPRVRRLCR